VDDLVVFVDGVGTVVEVAGAIAEKAVGEVAWLADKVVVEGAVDVVGAFVGRVVDMVGLAGVWLVAAGGVVGP